MTNKELLNASAYIVNLTPHPVDIVDRNWSVLISIPSEGTPHRCSAQSEVVDELFGIPVFKTTYVDDNPIPEDGRCYIVSLITAEANPGRGDLYVPSGIVRNDGAVVGCRGLSVNPYYAEPSPWF